MTAMRDLLGRLCNEFGPSGRERTVRQLIRDEIADQVERVDVDALGNLSAFKPGTGPEPRLSVMIAAHMDEVGFMVIDIDKGGVLKFSPVGGIDPRLLLGKRVLIGDERVPGIICAPVPHLQSDEQVGQVIPLKNLYIDIGAASGKEAGDKVKVGDYGIFATQFTVLSGDAEWPTVRGKAFDDRAGCAALIRLLADEFPVDLHAVFTVQEEVGLRGAKVAAFRIAPDAAFSLEGTICADLPRKPDEDRTLVTRMGHGPAITLMDRSLVSHPGLLKLLRETAEAEGIAIQYKTPGLGGTDSGAIHISRIGVPSTVVAVPCRHIHGPAAILNLNDLENVVRLVGGALRRIGPEHLTRED